MSTTTRRRTAATVAASALAGGALGIGGTSFALWSDDVTVTGTIPTGYEYFAVGEPGDPVAATNGASTFSVGPDEARALFGEGEIAIPIQVDSLSQGNKGLTYTLAPPDDWGDGIFEAADVHLFFVDDEGPACETEILTPQTVPTGGGYTSTPVSAEYSSHEIAETEYWCLYASFDGPPRLGEYENTAKVTAEPPHGETIEDDDSWQAVVAADLDPDAEPDHHLTFSYTTFRPGETP